MTDPTAAAATAASVEIGVLTLTTLGVEPQALLWGGNHKEVANGY